MSTDELAKFFQVWISQEDWKTDKHKFYKSLGHAVHAARPLPDGDVLAAALQHAHKRQFGEHVRVSPILFVYCEAARSVVDYLRATQ